MWKPIASIFITLATIIFTVTFVVPEYERVQELRKNIATLDSVSGDIKTSQVLLDETAASLKNIPQEGENRFSLLIPEVIDHLRFANMLKEMAANRGIVLREIKVSKEQSAALVGGGNGKDESGLFSNIKNTFSLDQGARTGGVQAGEPSLKNRNYVTTQGQISFTATYQGFLFFLSDIEKSLILMDVTELSFSPRKEGARKSAVPLYDYQMQVETYSLQ